MIFSTFPNLTGLVVNLCFLRQTEFSLNHEMAVEAFLRHSLNLGEAYTQHLSIITPENGRLHYRESDPYRFVIIGLGNTDTLNPIWQTLITHLQKLPDSAPITDKKVPLKNNVKLIGLQDFFDGKPITHTQFHPLETYTLTRAAEQAQAWFEAAKLQTQPLTLQWYWKSTARLLKEAHPERKDQTGENRYCRDKSHLTPYLLLKRIYETLLNINNQFGHQTPKEINKSHQAWLKEQAHYIQLTTADVYWIDTPYYNQDHQKNTLGGLAGHMQITLTPGIEPGTLGLILLGQMVGIGQRRASGQGKYLIQHPLKKSYLQLGTHPMNITRSQSLLEHLTQTHIITQAIHQTEQKPNIDKLTDKTHSQIQTALGQIKKQDYKPPVLQGFTIPKKDGEDRLLAVSPLYDRILQKATALILTPGLNALMSQGSYGYRKGLSRQQVRYEIQNAYRQGYHWVYESDIDDFFDDINRQQLINRLTALYGKDPLWPLLHTWLSQDIHIKNTIIERKNTPTGIPQGSPLSPLLANFILDDFDSDLETYGYKIIRYADDFIILCKSQHQAQLAAEKVKESLIDLALTLNQDKTHIIDMKQGFQFLGYLFREDHAIEIGGKTADGRTSYAAETAPANLPPWLANLGTKPAQPIQDEDRPKIKQGDIEELGTHLIFAGDAQYITTDNHNLIAKKEDIITQKITWEQIHAITLIGLHHMTLPAQHQALAHKIPVHYADRTGTYLGSLTSSHPAQNNYKNWFIQLQMSDNTEYALQFARNLVDTRLEHQRKTLLRRKHHRKALQNTLTKIKQLQHKAKHAPTLASLNGYEGTATKHYFQQFNLLLPQWAHFSKRSRRPPKDAFNVLLSLGYTILYTHVDSILQAAGLLTWKGIYHQQSPAHAALASDIMETYRHIIERNALEQINQNRIKAQDFKPETTPLGQTTLRLTAQARRNYINSIITRFQKFSQTQTLHQHLYQQAQHLKESMHTQQPFKPWKEQK